MDFYLKKGMFGILAATVLASCSSGGGDNSTPATLAQAVGNWTETFSDGDQYFRAIRADGNFSYYDYMGDSFDEGQDCYIYEGDGYMTDKGNGDFEVVMAGFPTVTAQVRVSGANVTITGSVFEVSFHATLTPSANTDATIQAKLCGLTSV